ncbi:MAG TPA: DUF1565 domain-containing protein [Prosthecobacter sp.]
MKLRIILPFFCLALGTAPLLALQVDPAAGDDKNDGVSAPLKTIARAVRLAQPGDTVLLKPGTYWESVDLSNKHGQPGKPVTVDGQGAVINGSEPVKAVDWESLGGGLFRKVKLMPRMDKAILGRWFFLWNGSMNHMGRTSKGPSKPLKKVEELQVNEWTYAEAEDAFYLKLPEGQGLDAANIRYPARSSGVILSGKGAHLVVRNITCTHVYNDGFNIHGDQVDTVFEKIAAIDCGDDGFSAHEAAECRIDGFVSIGNSTGLCDTVSSVTHYKNVFISRCLGHDIFFIGDSPHSMENVLVESSAAYALTVSRHGDREQKGLSRVHLKNVVMRRRPDLAGNIRVTGESFLEAENCTFLGLDAQVTPRGEMKLTKSVIAPSGDDRKPEVLIYAEARWSGAGNRYDLKSLRWGPALYNADIFAQFQDTHTTEAGSKWLPGPLNAETGIGADEKALETLRRP